MAGSHLAARAAGVARGRRRPAGLAVRRRDSGRCARRHHPHGDLPQDAACAAAERVAAAPGAERRPTRSVPFEAQTIGRASKGSRRAVSVATVGPLDAGPADPPGAVARAHLAGLVGLFQRGMCEPLPLFCKTSAAYALDRALGTGARRGRPGGAQGMGVERTSRDNENRDKEHVFVLGGELSFPEMLRALTGILRQRRATTSTPPSPIGSASTPAWSGTDCWTSRGSGSSDARSSRAPADEAMPVVRLSAARCRGARRCSRRAPGTGKTFTIAAPDGPLRRGGRHADRPSPRHDVHPHGHGRAPRTGAGPAGARLRRLGRRPGRQGAPRRTTRSCGSWRTCRGPSRSCGAAAWARRSPTSTPPRSRPRTGSACRSSTGSAPPATSTAT